MITKTKRKLKKIISKKIIFQPDIYEIDLDRKHFEVFDLKSIFRDKLFKQSFSFLSVLFQTDKASFIHSVTPNIKKNMYQRTITQSHDYAKYYDKIFSKIRNNVKNICEIGVMSGSSTAAFYFFFPKSKLFSLDITFQRFNIISKRIVKEVFDQSNQLSFDKFKKKTKKINFDIIIDDGSHVDEHIILTLKNLITRVKKKGYYVIEDASLELTPNTLKTLNDPKFRKIYKIKHVRIFKSEEGLNLIKKDGTKQNYIIFIQKK